MSFEEFLKEWRSEKGYILAHTSGSTGKPKEIRLAKDFVRESAKRTNYFFSIGEDSRLHSCVAADFIGGKMMAVRSEIVGCRLTWETPSNRPLQGIGKNEELTLVSVVPSQMAYLLQHQADLPKIDNILIGGSAIPPTLRKEIAKSGWNAYESYGMTETASHIALRKVEEDEGWFNPLAGINVYTDERGCLVIEFQTGDRFVTNDLAIIGREGRFKIEGRSDNVIITGGKKVSPESVERRLSTLFSSPIMITSEEDELWGRRVVLLSEGEEWKGEEERLKEEMRKVLERWEMPKEIKLNVTIPHTENGKIKRI